MKKILLIITGFFLLDTAYPQFKVVIRGFSEASELKSINISPPLRDCINGWVSIDKIPIDSTHHFEKTIYISHSTLIYLNCLDYVEAYVEPGDTINIYIKKLASSVQDFNGFMESKRNYQATIKGNHIYTNFFTLLEQQTGKMGNLPFLMQDDISDDNKRVLLQELYNRRISFLNEFIAKNPEINITFKNQVSCDIKGQYFANLLFPMHEGEKLSSNYLQQIDKESFSWDRVSTSQYLMQAAYNYFIYYKDNIPGENYSAKRFSDKYNNIKSYIKDIRLKEYFLTALMVSFLDKEPDNYQEIFEDYQKTCTNKIYINSVMQMYKANISKEYKGDSKLSNVALSVLVYDASGKSHLLSTILNQHKNGLVLLDFWASWCVPCIMQIPYLKELEKKYNSKILFISLSEDKNKINWLSVLQNNQLSENQYLIDESYKKDLLRELNIKTIPRFVLMTAGGKILNSDLPGPNEVDRLSIIIDKNLKKHTGN